MKSNNQENFANNLLLICQKHPKKNSKKKKNKDYTERPYKSQRKNKLLDKCEKRKSERKISKHDKYNACYKCGRIEHYSRDCKVKDKIKILDLDEKIKDSLCKILLNSSPEGSSQDNSESEESHTSEDLGVLHEEDYIPSSEEECLPCQIRESCEDKEQNTDNFYKLYAQFKDLNINVMSSYNWVKMLKMIDDPIIMSQIIDKIGNTNTSTSNTKISRENPAQEYTYTMEN